MNGSRNVQPLLACAALLAHVVLASACATPHRARACYTHKDVIDAYIGKVAGLVSNKSRNDVLDAHETVDVSFALDANGSASEFRADRAKRAEAAQEVLRAAAAAAPFPKPPFDPEACLWGGRAVIQLIGHVRCDNTRASAYTDAVAARIQGAVQSAGVSALEPDKVTLRVKIDGRGNAMAITVHDAKSTEAGERVAALARSLSPFEAPDESIRQCVVDHPLFIWVGLPGTTRPPVFIRDH